MSRSERRLRKIGEAPKRPPSKAQQFLQLLVHAQKFGF